MENCVIQPNTPNVVSEDFEGEIILVNLVNGNYYSLRKTAALIWHSIQSPRSYADLLTDLSTNYGITEDQKATVQEFINQMAEQQLIRLEALNGYMSQPSEFDTSEEHTFEPPLLEVYSDMQDLLLLDPIHDVDEESGWPNKPADE